MAFVFSPSPFAPSFFLRSCLFPASRYSRETDRQLVAGDSRCLAFLSSTYIHCSHTPHAISLEPQKTCNCWTDGRLYKCSLQSLMRLESSSYGPCLFGFGCSPLCEITSHYLSSYNLIFQTSVPFRRKKKSFYSPISAT